MRHIRWLLLVLPWPVALAGCGLETAPPPMPPTKAPKVEVTEPVFKSVTEYEEFTGMTQALQTIEVRARVSGYLAKVNFEDGAEVEKGTPLFEIDPRPYQ